MPALDVVTEITGLAVEITPLRAAFHTPVLSAFGAQRACTN